MKANNNHASNVDIYQLANKLKKLDIQNVKVTRIVRTIYWILLPIVVFVFTINVIEKDMPQIIGGACIIVSFFLIIGVFNTAHKKYKNVDYSLPVVEMLKKSADRYNPFNVKFSIGLLVGLTIMDIGIIQDSLPYNISIYKFQIFFWGFILLGFIVGTIIWYFKYKPLRDKTLLAISETKNEFHPN